MRTCVLFALLLLAVAACAPDRFCADQPDPQSCMQQEDYRR